MESRTDLDSLLIEQYIQDCKTNYLSPFNDGYAREYYKVELLRLKDILDQVISDNEIKHD